MNQFARFVVCTPLLLSAHLIAGDFEVISGSATASTQGSHTIIENSPQAILHWDHFSIQSQESLHFAQQSAASSVLNRVTGKELSALMGTLTSNGKVYLINPQGVLVGPNASIETAGFIASTSDILNADFLKGKELLFNLPGDGKIINQGMIHCPEGDIFLIAKEISNEGTCTGNFVGIASGTQVLIRPDGAQRVFIRCEPLDSGEIDQTGTLQALAIELKTSSPYDKAIRMGGTTEVLCLSQEGGKIILSAEHGTVQVDGNLIASSGQIHVLGKEISLASTAHLDASGDTGGSVIIGGGKGGMDPNFFNAENLNIEKGALITANGTLFDGGEVILWSNGFTDVHGQISVTGERDGGFVEVSGRENVNANVFPERAGRTGKPGLLVIDPGSVGIVPGGSSMNPFGATYIETQLGLGDVTINTATDGTDMMTETLTVEGSVVISWSANTTLSLIAGSHVLFESPGAMITNSAAGNFIVKGNGTIDPMGAGIITEGPASFIFHDGNIDLFGKSITGSGFSRGCLFQNLTASTTGSGNITIQGIGGSGDGITFVAASALSTINGNINMQGELTPGFSGAAAGGFTAESSLVISSTGSGNISVSGLGPEGALGGQGVSFSFSTLEVHDGDLSIIGPTKHCDLGVVLSLTGVTSTGKGNISIAGSSLTPTTGPAATGVFLQLGTIQSSGTGQISINGLCGQAGQKGGTALSIGGQILSSAGAINLQGTARGTDPSNHGILFQSSGHVSGTNEASITLIGSASPSSTTGSTGILMDGGSSTFVQTVDGTLTLIGSGSGLSFSNLGITLANTARVEASGSGALIINTLHGSDLTLTGGVAVNANALISNTTGPATLNIGGNLILTGGTALNSQAQIGSQSTQASGSITFSRIGGTTLLNGFNGASYAAIGHGTPDNGASTLSGNLSLLTVGDITLQGALAGAGTSGFAQIGHLEQSGQVSTLSGNISVSSQGSINVLGGSSATAISQIGHGNLSGTSIVGASQMTIKAGVNSSILSSIGDARMINLSSVAGSGNLTLVVDNLYPNPPHAGDGSFIFGSTLLATGKLKIYTSTQSQNVITPGTLINGAPFYPGKLYKNSSTEEWGIWFPAGTYGNTPFKFYYKDDFIGIPPQLVIANMGSLTDLLPVLATREFNDQFLNGCRIWKKKLFYCEIEHSPILSVNWTESANDLTFEFIVLNEPSEEFNEEEASEEFQF